MYVESCVDSSLAGLPFSSFRRKSTGSWLLYRISLFYIHRFFLTFPIRAPWVKVGAFRNYAAKEQMAYKRILVSIVHVVGTLSTAGTFERDCRLSPYSAGTGSNISV
jgi:hypothetical protein